VLLGGVIFPVALAAVYFAFRPAVTVVADKHQVYSRVDAGGAPNVRLLVHNTPVLWWLHRRAARGSRVLVESYRSVDDSESSRVTLGSPSLDWWSAPDADAGSLTVFPGPGRPIDLGTLVKGDPYDPAHPPPNGDPDEDKAMLARGQWLFRLALYGVDRSDRPHVLKPGAWIVRVLVAADDARARIYDVHHSWVSDAPTPEAALKSVKVKVRRVRRV
jgi:hypothetical protein